MPCAHSTHAILGAVFFPPATPAAAPAASPSSPVASAESAKAAAAAAWAAALAAGVASASSSSRRKVPGPQCNPRGQSRWSVPLENLPNGQSAHSWSDVAVPLTFMYSLPEAQRRQSVQYGTFSSVLKEPFLQPAQTRSRLLKGDVGIHSPTPHVDHALQLCVLASAVNWPKSQSVQTWSDVLLPVVRTR